MTYLALKLSKGTVERLQRIMELKNYKNTEEALDFAIALGWIAAEKQAVINKLPSVKIEIDGNERS